MYTEGDDVEGTFTPNILVYIHATISFPKFAIQKSLVYLKKIHIFFPQQLLYIDFDN